MSSAIVKNSLTNLKAFLQDHQASFTSGLLILFTVGGEQIFKESTFNCPCKQPQAWRYALAFLIVPAVVLLLIGIAVSNLTWRLFHGCTSRRGENQGLNEENSTESQEDQKNKDKTRVSEEDQKNKDKTRVSEEDQKNKDKTCKNTKNGFCNIVEHSIMVFARSAVVPLAWIFVAFLDGNYYACMIAEEPCNKNRTEEYNYLKAESQFWSWVGLGVLVFIAFVVTCCVRCCDSVTYEQNKFIQSYRNAEQEKLDSEIQTCAGKLAEANVKRFMEERNCEKVDWDVISRIPEKKVVEKDGKIERIFFTYLKDWVTEHPKQPTQQETNNSAQPTQQETNNSAQPTQQETNNSAQLAKQGTSGESRVS